MSLKRSRLKSGSKPLDRGTRLSPVTKDPNRRRRNKARRDVEYGRDGRGDFATFVRAQGCVVPGAKGTASSPAWGETRACYGRTEAAHLRGRGAHPGVNGVGNIAGLCEQHHAQQEHATASFNRIYGLDYAHECVVLANLWEDLTGGRAS